MAKVYVVTDLGVGDGGKGGVVHKVATMLRAHTIIKRGGAQGSHGVRTSRGESFAFSQWGCGTFDGIPTHLSGQMVVSPEGLLNEASALRYTHGITDPFSLLTADEEALCATPFHGIASRLKELARGNTPRGTIGSGVGEAYRDYGRLPELAITVKDLRSDLRSRLTAVRDQIRRDLAPLIEGEFLPDDRALVAEEIGLLNDDGFLEYVIKRFSLAGRQTNIVPSEFLRDNILSRDGTAMVETSHGVLSDRMVGFHPHTSAIRTLPRFTHDMLSQIGFAGEVVDIGVFRAYAIRHGAGPMPTTSLGLGDSLLPGSNKDNNRYQGDVRVGPLDFVLLRYALAACGGANAFDGLAVTWFDQIQNNKFWSWCDSYERANDPTFFTPSGELRVGDGSLAYQELLGQRLLDSEPVVSGMPIDSTKTRDELYSICATKVEQSLGIPVRMISFGPTELDKLTR